MDRNEIWHDLHHLGVPSGTSKMISEPMVHLAQTVLLSCVKISTISKWTEPSFHMSLLALEYDRVRSKRFLTLWYIWHKPSTYLALTLTPSLNELKWDSTWATSPRSSIGFVQNYFQAYGSLAQTMHLSCVKISTISKRTETSFHLSLVT
jgi:hypothetical protein